MQPCPGSLPARLDRVVSASALTMPSFKSDLSEEEALILVRDVMRQARKGDPIDPQSQPDRLMRAQVTPLAGPR